MDMFYKELGAKLRNYRKVRKISLNELSGMVHKSLSTLSKYEKGEIEISIDVLIDICKCLDIEISEILPHTRKYRNDFIPDRFENSLVNKQWVYWYKNIDKRIHTSFVECDNVLGKAGFYFDVNNVDNIIECRFEYVGNVHYNDYNIVFYLINKRVPYDSLVLSIPAISEEHAYRVGLLATLNFKYQNVAIKVLTSDERIEDKNFLLEKLKISADDIRVLKDTNFFTP